MALGLLKPMFSLPKPFDATATLPEQCAMAVHEELRNKQSSPLSSHSVHRSLGGEDTWLCIAGCLAAAELCSTAAASVLLVARGSLCIRDS